MKYPCLLLIGAAAVSQATALKVEIVKGAPPSAESVRVRVAWENAWNNDRNHDAAWIFFSARRGGQGPWRPVTFARAAGAGANRDGLAMVEVPADRLGAFVFPAEKHRGKFDWTGELQFDPVAGPADAAVEWRAFGIEMVHIPEGPFSVGDVDEKSVQMNAFFRSDAQGNPAGRLRITSEAEIPVGPREGALWYKVATPEYQGDGQGPIPEAFPKGFKAFYMMKYELTQGLYAEFLNHISEQASALRAIQGGLRYKRERGTIEVDAGRFVARSPDRPANWVSWNDSIAFAAWARLRPMTEFEYTKASRGPVEPPLTGSPYPWGTTSKERLRRQIVPPVDDLVTTGEAQESLLTDDTRDVLGASYYWVLDLAGSVWERVVTPGAAAGRSFKGSHGNGIVSGFGTVSNPDWPKGDDLPNSGYGYRGGGYYSHDFKHSDFNPHSPTEWRRFGSWGQGPRSVAYGFRAVRTAAP
jgi:formylglycine-generating enzyme required for sulfatase activity